jgi:ADP-heptose:LPS heptosyltransferase
MDNETTKGVAKNDKKYIVFIVDGGIGKHIVSTAVIRAAKKQYPEKEIVVVSGYPDVYKFNPHVYRAYLIGNTPYIYEDYIKDAIVLKSQPYYHNEYISGTKHIVECWCEQLNLKFDGVKPEIVLSSKEDKMGDMFRTQHGKPILLMQVTGGAPPQIVGCDCNDPNCEHKDKPRIMPAPKMFIRNLPVQTAKNVSDELAANYKPILIALDTQASWMLNSGEQVEHISAPIRQLFAAIKHSNKLLFIDSFAQHAAAALGRKAVVLWGSTNPKTLGYDMHTNLSRNVCDTPHCDRPNSFLFDTDFKNQPWECPYSEACMNHDVLKIVQALNGEKAN